MTRHTPSYLLRRKRAVTGLIGFMLGLIAGFPITLLLHGWAGIDYRSLPWFALGGAALALLYGERKRRLPTRDDVEAAKFDEELHPLGLRPDGNGHSN